MFVYHTFWGAMADWRGIIVNRGKLLATLLTLIMVLGLNSGNILCMYNEDLGTAQNQI
jgi:hypothetical protein